MSSESASEPSRLAERLITAEQDERRRLALFLHDGPVQSLAGIALMLDAVVHAIDEERLDTAKEILGAALERHRAAIRTLRDLSFNLEPVVLRDRGFSPAVRALADGMSNADVAQRLFISQETVKSHVRHILAKLEADTRTHAVAIALRDAIID